MVVGAQYKSRTPFVDLSHASEDLDIKQVERQFLDFAIHRRVYSTVYSVFSEYL